MARSPLQRGPEKGHYHDTLGVEPAFGTLTKPYTVHFDDPGIESTPGGGFDPAAGIELDDLPVGSIITNAWGFLIEQWDTGSSDVALFAFVKGSGNWEVIGGHGFDCLDSESSDPITLMADVNSPGTPGGVAYVDQEGAVLKVQISRTAGSAPVAGEAVIVVQMLVPS